MYDSNGRKMVDVVISNTWYPDFTILEAYYEDDGSKVPDHELDAISNDDISMYHAGLLD